MDLHLNMINIINMILAIHRAHTSGLASCRCPWRSGSGRAPQRADCRGANSQEVLKKEHRSHRIYSIHTYVCMQIQNIGI